MASTKVLKTLTIKNKKGTTSPIYEFCDEKARQDVQNIEEELDAIKSKVDFEFATDDDIYALFNQEASE